MSASGACGWSAAALTPRGQALAPLSLVTMGGEGLNQGLNLAGKGINDSLRLTGAPPP